MAKIDPLAHCLAEIALRGFDGARAAVTRREAALLGEPRMAADLILRRGGAAHALPEHRMAALEMLVDLARMDAENRGRFGGPFLAAAESAVDELTGSDGLDPDAAMALGRAWVRGGVDAPEALASFFANRGPDDAGAAEFPEILEQIFDDLCASIGNEYFLLYGLLHENLSGVAGKAYPAFVSDVARRDAEHCGQLALYWLLHPKPEVRLAAAGGLAERARRGTLEPAAAARLPAARNWIPPDDARSTIDTALRDARRGGLCAPEAAPAPRRERAFGTLPDGPGVQALIAETRGENGRAVGMMLLKTGYGVKEAVPIVGDPEAANLLESQKEVNAREISWAALERALAAALAEGLAAGRPAPPGLLDVAAFCGLESLRPAPMSPRGWLAAVDPEGEIARAAPETRDGLIDESKRWIAGAPNVRQWYEGSVAIGDPAREASDGRDLYDELWERLEERREHWAVAALRSAHILKAGGDDGLWRSFAAVGREMLEGRELADLPIMDVIVENSVHELRTQTLSRIGADRLFSPEALARADGQLTAALLAPKPPGFEAWFDSLDLGADEPDPGATVDLRPLLAITLATRRKELEGVIAAGDFGALAPGAETLTPWAEGFRGALGALKPCWPRRELTAKDRRATKRIAELAAGAPARKRDLDEIAAFVFRRAAVTEIS